MHFQPVDLSSFFSQLNLPKILKIFNLHSRFIELNKKFETFLLRQISASDKATYEPWFDLLNERDN